MKPATLWQFVMKKTGSGESWTWRRTAADGSVEAASTGSHGNYGDVVYDAIRHGFHPKQEQWIVTDGAFSSHYFPDAGRPKWQGHHALRHWGQEPAVSHSPTSALTAAPSQAPPSARNRSTVALKRAARIGSTEASALMRLRCASSTVVKS
jgi:hypothetical protein